MRGTYGRAEGFSPMFGSAWSPSPTGAFPSTMLRHDDLRRLCGRIAYPPFAHVRALSGTVGRDGPTNTISPPALQQARQRRKTLHDALVHLEEALSSPAAGRIKDWTAHVVKEMREVEAAFEQHCGRTEQQDGLYDEILERAPRLAGNVRRLRDEHPEIREGIREP